MSLIQILLSVYFAFVGAYLSVVLTRLLIQNGTAIRELGDKMSQQHQDIIEAIKEMRQDTVELLKKGFGDLSRDVGEIKKAVNK